MSEWRETTLGKVAEVQTGPFGSQLKNEQYITGGTPVVTVEHIKDFLIDDFIYPSITDEDKNRLERYILKSGDIVFSRVGSVDLSAIVKNHQNGWLFSSRMLRVRVKEELDTNFLSYYLRQSSIRQYINNIAVGSTMPSINTAILKSLPIVYCSFQEQKKIADVLSCLDAKIENLRSQNQTLEKIAQTLFNHWFIDFEFPNDSGEPYRLSGGAMVDSELGDIPVGWYVGVSGEIINLQGGFAFKSEDFQKVGKHGVIKIKNISDSVIDINKTDFIPDSIACNTNRKFKISSGDILIAMTGAEVAKIGVIPKTEKSLFLNQRVGLFEEKIKGGKLFIYYLFTRQEYQKLLSDRGSGSSAQPNISASDIEAINIVIPVADVLGRFEKTINCLFEKRCENLLQIQTLTKTRDTLLPKLMSGQIRVAE